MDRRSLIDDKIRILLSSTDLTFKQIIEKLKSENMPASFNTIRRVNRNHRYRKPRYDAKLTPQQRKELIVKLKNTSKPNLSSLARQYGVCHGSIWYWWDKLSKIREKHNGVIPKNEPSLDFDDMMIEQDYEDNGSGSEHYNGHQQDESEELGDLDSDPLELVEEEENNNSNRVNKEEDPHQLQHNTLGDLEVIGRVQAKNLKGEYVRLPILMYAPISCSNIWNLASPEGSHMDHISAVSTPSTSTGQSSSSSISSRLQIGSDT